MVWMTCSRTYSFRVVELRRIVPGKTGAVVAVIHIARRAVVMVAQPEDNGCIGLVVVVVFNLDLDAAVGGKIRPVEAVGRERALPAIEKPVGMVDHPVGVDAHVVRNHVAGHANAEMRRASLQAVEGFVSAQVAGNVVSLERVGRGDGVTRGRAAA